MGREIRRVARDWEHPKNKRGDYIPLFDGASFAGRMADWEAERTKWDGDDASFEGSRPDPADYMPRWSEAEATHWQMYEDTSEGTPISPVFTTVEACAQWCADTGASAFGDLAAPYEWWMQVAEGSAGFGLIMHGNGQTELA